MAALSDVADVSVIFSPAWAQHAPEAQPESPERLDWALAGAALGLTGRDDPAGLTTRAPDRGLTDDQLFAVHSRAYVRFLDEFAAHGGGLLAFDTQISPVSPAIARSAAAGACLAVDLAFAEGRPSLALLRPPGHHAAADTGSGFCLFNNAALAARHALANHPTPSRGRVAIFDWDVHHGNGTAAIFAADPQVLYVSIHESPHYPFTGWPDEVGAGPGRGLTINLPLPGGLSTEQCLLALERVVLPCLRHFAPGLVIVSAGQDGHWSDPMGTWQLSAAGYHRLALAVGRLAEETGTGLVALMEGGYSPTGLRLGTAGIAAGLCGREPAAAVLADGRDLPSPAPRQQEAYARRLAEIVDIQSVLWPLR